MGTGGAACDGQMQGAPGEMIPHQNPISCFFVDLGLKRSRLASTMREFFYSISTTSSSSGIGIHEDYYYCCTALV